jgi:lipid-A-disaccharide synthase-like uncharacterized protein
MDDWRVFLYPIGFLSSLAFGARFLLQWMTSEWKKESTVTPAFWKISLVGNLLLLAHSSIQMQFHVALIQTCNGFISWRNLNLMQPSDKQATFGQAKMILSALILAITSLFYLQALFFSEMGFDLFRIPVTPWSREEQVSPLWHALGMTGLLLFNSRFWVQWWNAERHQNSYLGPSFWWLSLIGDAICLAYFNHLGDPVNLIGPLLGLIPYIRNLMLLRKTKLAANQLKSP